MTKDTRSQRERMLAGDLYIADDPELAAESLRAQELAQEYNASIRPTRRAGGGSSPSCSGRSARTPRSGRRSTATTAGRSTWARGRS